MLPETIQIGGNGNNRHIHFFLHMPNAWLIAEVIANRRQMTFRIDQDSAAILTGAFHAFGEGRGFALAAAASVDDNRAELAQDAADEREALQMVARHESQVVDFWIDQEAIAPARMFGR